YIEQLRISNHTPHLKQLRPTTSIQLFLPVLIRELTHKTRSMSGSFSLRVGSGVSGFNDTVAEELPDFLPIHGGLLQMFDHSRDFYVLFNAAFGLCTHLHAASNFMLQPR